MPCTVFMNATYTLKKEERIFKKKEIERIFESGDSFKVFPLRMVFILNPSDSPESIPSILISVPKKKFRHAVKRNRIKRLVRESYRLNSFELKASLQEKKFNLEVAFLYIGSEVLTYQEIENAMKNALELLKKKLP